MNLPRNDQNRIISFKEAVDNLAPALAESKYSTWIRFEAGDIQLDTRDRDSNFFISCNNKKNGSGSANSFSISIAYLPKPGEDPNYIDLKLYGPNARAGYEDTVNMTPSDTTKVAILNKCTLQYGYNEFNVYSPKYEGQLIDYSVEINNGMLLYTLTGYSNIIQDIEAKHPFEQVGTQRMDGEETVEENLERPTVVAKQALEKYLTSGYTVEIDKSAQGKDKAMLIGAKDDSTLFSYVNSVLSQARDEDENDDTKIEDKSIYYFTVTDIEDQKKVTIKRSSRKEAYNVIASVIFDWMGGFGNNTSIYTGNLVISFRTEFQGAVALAAKTKKEDSKNNEDENAYSINSYGETVTAKTFIGDAYSGDFLSADAAKTLSEWAMATQYSYKATLTTVGLPCDIPLGEYIRVRPLIYGQEHLTGGIYMITGCEDTVDSNGFITTLSLVKIMI